MPARGRRERWLRRNSGLLGLVAILGLFLLAGLLVGHWVSQEQDARQQTIEVEGLGGLAAGGAAAATSTGGSGAGAAEKAIENRPDRKRRSRRRHNETAKKRPPAGAERSHERQKKLTQSNGKKHQEEINALGAEPIETG